MNFKDEFKNAITRLYPNGLEWDLVGVLTKSSKVYTLSYDSKILSGIFEILCEPVIIEIAEQNGYELFKGVQNQYPEFTLFDPAKPNSKIAVDIKSTYRQKLKNGNVKPFAFTLGSYRSYLQDPSGKKGILFPYSDYSEHWVIGFLYDRNLKLKNIEIRSIIEAAQLEAPYSNIEFFVQHKHSIAGKVKGSGNTTNISSIKSCNIEDFSEGRGPFKTKEEFENFWKNF
ncbi:MAG TPA: type II restriction endonuclease [Chitinophagaceae bacterium]|nr:type II restriction endonuclease [Chitinophagaceae bacterium]HNU12958.1 type II restriction endonuclease [Chitinophagaceae bacterium]